jgi:putative tricarboxylic transport membrane protein
MSKQWKNLVHGEVLAGLILSSLGIFILIRAMALEYTGDFGPGPGFLPFWLGVVIISFSTLVIFVTLRSSNARKILSDERIRKPSRSLFSWLALTAHLAQISPREE